MHELPRVDARHRAWLALILALAADYLALGLASDGHTRVLGTGGGVLIVAASIAATASTPRLAVTLAALGATPLAVSTWRSIVTPALATVTIAITLAATRGMRHRRYHAGQGVSMGEDHPVVCTSARVRWRRLSTLLAAAGDSWMATREIRRLSPAP